MLLMLLGGTTLSWLHMNLSAAHMYLAALTRHSF